MTYEELLVLALEHYNEGGDCVYECWERTEFNAYVEMFGPMTHEQAFALFRTYKQLEIN